MSRRKKIVSVGLIFLVGGLLLFSFRQPAIPRTMVDTTSLSTVSLRIDFGDPSAGEAQNFSAIPYVTGATAFSILEEVAVKERIPFVYDPSTGAGVFIRQIGEKKNGDGGRYWQYWVNDRFAMVAADQYPLSAGDAVKWKFATEQKE